MMRPLLLTCLLLSNLSFAQPASVSLEEKNHTLSERYHLMKSNSQTYQDYKVIKEFVLDGVWKIVIDTVKAQKLLLSQSHEKISQLEASLQSVEMTLKKERDASAEITHDSTHIALLGVDIKKGAFLTFLTFVFAGFILAISFIAGKMRLMRTNMKEKVLIADVISHEFEEFKRRALEKQTKLSRELQNERNKLEELKAQYK
jgi:hypothetical protein